jgi:hypothetical protein
MASVSSVTVVGNLGSDPQTRMLRSGLDTQPKSPNASSKTRYGISALVRWLEDRRLKGTIHRGVLPDGNLIAERSRAKLNIVCR